MFCHNSTSIHHLTYVQQNCGYICVFSGKLSETIGHPTAFKLEYNEITHINIDRYMFLMTAIKLRDQKFQPHVISDYNSFQKRVIMVNSIG